ncbi:MAG: hypothetical protein M1818_004743 [Claussenomyces sp. TS43310]|nr:MAG: hypothetical protein M1818_004743 [Claussenomyces sp. TS43310]
MASSAVGSIVGAESYRSHNRVPIVDFAAFLSDDGEESSKAAEELFNAFKDVGFVYLQNHSLPQDVIDEAFTYSAKFFALPESIKMKAPHPPEGWWHRGYSGIGREKVSHMVFDSKELAALRKMPDIKESFEMGREDSPKLPNIWLPEQDLPGFRAFFNAFYARCDDLKGHILRALATGMHLDPDFFARYHRDADNQTRILHYPSVAEKILRQGRGERIAAHSDFGTITLLLQDAIGGLEVESPSGSGNFVPVPHIPNTVLVNVGDFLQRWSNDLLKSTMHRVRAPPSLSVAIDGNDGDHVTPERYSIPYFCGPDVDKIVECIEGCYGPGNPKKYKPITAGQYLDMRLNATY